MREWWFFVGNAPMALAFLISKDSVCALPTKSVAAWNNSSVLCFMKTHGTVVGVKDNLAGSS
jgi:hypothetical protein